MEYTQGQRIDETFSIEVDNRVGKSSLKERIKLTKRVGYSAYRSAMIGLSEFPESRTQIPAFSFFGLSLIWTAGMIVLTYFVVKDLKRGKSWAWVGGLCVLLVTTPSFALPASIIGLISLLDEDVRSEFLAKLDVKL